MRNLLLSAALIITPVGVFAAGYAFLAPSQSTQQSAQADTAPSLGDMSSYVAIARDVQQMAEAGHLAIAEMRIKDLETAWDDHAAVLRPINSISWGNIDDAIDAALSALREPVPDQLNVEAVLANLQVSFADPAGSGEHPGGAALMVSGVATTDAVGRPLPCEIMLETFRAARAEGSIAPADIATVSMLQAKGTERCNADDDARADDFLAQGIALMSN